MAKTISLFDEEVLKAAATLRGVPDGIWKLIIEGSKEALRTSDEAGRKENMTETQMARRKETGSAYLELCLAAQAFLRAGEAYAGVKVKNMILAREERRAREEG